MREAKRKIAQALINQYKELNKETYFENVVGMVAWQKIF